MSTDIRTDRQRTDRQSVYLLIAFLCRDVQLLRKYIFFTLIVGKNLHCATFLCLYVLNKISSNLVLQRKVFHGGGIFKDIINSISVRANWRRIQTADVCELEKGLEADFRVFHNWHNRTRTYNRTLALSCKFI